MGDPTKLPPPADLATFLQPNGDILHDVLVEYLNVSEALKGTLQLGTLRIQDISDKVKWLNGLMEELRNKQAEGTDPMKKKSLGSPEEARKLIEKLQSAGIEIVPDDYNKEAYEATQSKVGVWLSNLQSKADNLSTDSQKEQTRTQQLLGGYQGFLEASSAVTKKREGIQESVTSKSGSS